MLKYTSVILSGLSPVQAWTLIMSIWTPRPRSRSLRSTLENGVPIQINHDYQPLNCGRSTSGSFNREKEIVTAGGYIQEGLTDVDSDSVIARLLAGTSPEASVGFRGETACSFDGTPMHWLFGTCEYGHYRGQKILVDGDGNETVDVEERR